MSVEWDNFAEQMNLQPLRNFRIIRIIQNLRSIRFIQIIRLLRIIRNLRPIYINILDSHLFITIYVYA